jgi:NADH-quinone oxidoreductase subunit L
VLVIAMVLVMLAAFTKSAQFPFHEWLPDAMEGPTPVSAFLHSSTMVKAGVFIIAVLLPVYMNLHMGWLLILFGAITALLGILNALAETHIKRILAYSTIEDMGLMFIALGFGSLIGAMLLFIVQAFYKALLFMSAGTIMKANDDSTNIYKNYLSYSYKPFFIALLIGALSIAGIFPLSGFFGKLGVEIPATSMYIYILLLAMDFASSIYIFRWLLIPMRRPDSNYSDAELRMNYKLTPKSMLVPQYILAAIVLIAGISYIYVPHYLESYSGSSIYITIISSIMESIFVIAGILVALYLFRFHIYKSSFSEKHRSLFTIMYNSIITNTFYNYTALAFSKLSKIFDMFDYSLYGFIKTGGRSFVLFGNFIRKVENGQINTYALAFIIGFIILLIMVLGI